MDFDQRFVDMLSTQEQLDTAYQKGKWDERLRILHVLAELERQSKSSKRKAHEIARLLWATKD